MRQGEEGRSKGLGGEEKEIIYMKNVSTKEINHRA